MARVVDTDLFIFVVDAGEDALRSEDVTGHGFSRLDAQIECLIGPVRSTIEQFTTNQDELVLYTLGEDTYHRTNVAIIVTSRGRASVALPATSSAIEFYSTACALPRTASGGASNLPAGLALASLVARKANSPRIIAFVAGNIPDPSSSFPLNKASKDASALSSTLLSRVESLPLKGSELTLVSLASPKELGTTTVHALESSIGKERIRWVDAVTRKEESQQNQCVTGDGSDNTDIQYLLDLKLSIADEAGIPSFIASKTTPNQERNHSAPPPNQQHQVSTLNLNSAPAAPAASAPPKSSSTSTTSKSSSYQKYGPLQRSSFTCRDACLDVLLHHSRSGLLRSKMPTYSTLAYRSSQDKNTDSNGNSITSRANTAPPGSCYIRIMPQPKYRTLLTFKGALLMSRAGYDSAPTTIAVKLAALTATTTREVVFESHKSQFNEQEMMKFTAACAANQSRFRGRSRPGSRELGRGPMGVFKIIQNLNDPELLLLTWVPETTTHDTSEESSMPSSSPPLNGSSTSVSQKPLSSVDDSLVAPSSSSVPATKSGGAGNSGSSSSDAMKKSCSVPEPFNMFSSKPPVTLASLLQTLRGNTGGAAAGGGGAAGSGAGGSSGSSAIPNTLQNPFYHEGWEYWDRSQHVPSQYTQQITKAHVNALSTSLSNSMETSVDADSNGGAGGGGSDSSSSVTVVESMLKQTVQTTTTTHGTTSSTNSNSSGADVYENGFIILFNTPPSPPPHTPGQGGATSASASASVLASMTSADIPPIWMPVGTRGVSTPRVNSSKLSSITTTPAAKPSASAGMSGCIKNTSLIAKTALFVSMLISNSAFLVGFMLGFAVYMVQQTLSMMERNFKDPVQWKYQRAAAGAKASVGTHQQEERKHSSPAATPSPSPSPSSSTSPFTSSLTYPVNLTETILSTLTIEKLFNELSYLMKTPPRVSITEVRQSLGEAVAKNNNKTQSGTPSSGHPAAIIIGPLDHTAISYLMKQQQNQETQQHQQSQHQHVVQHQQQQQQMVDVSQQQQQLQHNNRNCQRQQQQPQPKVIKISDGHPSQSQTVAHQGEVLSQEEQPQQKRQRKTPSSPPSLPLPPPVEDVFKVYKETGCDYKVTSFSNNNEEERFTAMDTEVEPFGFNIGNTSSTSTATASTTVKRKIAITMGDSAASGEVAVTVNGRKVPFLSSSPSSGCLGDVSTEMQEAEGPENQVVVARAASLPISIPCCANASSQQEESRNNTLHTISNEVSSDLFMAEQNQDGDEEEEVKMPLMPLTPPGAGVSAVAAVAVARAAGGLESSAPPPNPDTAE